MIHSLPLEQVRRLRLRAQRLMPQEADVAGTVRAICGVQAQDAAAAALAVRVRCPGAVAADVTRALEQDRSLVRTWCMRGTLHLLAAQDAGWVLPLLGPLFIRANRSRRLQLGLDDDTAERGVRLLRDALAAHGSLTRAEIVEELARRGLPLAGQARPHLLGLAAAQGVICYGPARGREPTYVLLEQWLKPGHALPPAKASAELAMRYVAAYAPAAPEDFAAWSGLSLGTARAAWQQIAGKLLEVSIGESPAWMLKGQAAWLDDPPPAGPVVRLLPAFDTLWLGYRSRAIMLAPEHARRIVPGGGILHPALLVDGRGAGTWRISRSRARLDLLVEPFGNLTDDVREGLALEAADVGRFLGSEATLQAG
jgi:hypothetical protein